MAEEDVITIGNTIQNHDTLTHGISQCHTTEKNGVVVINFNKEENEDKIVEELNTLILQEEKYLTGNKIDIIEKLLNKLPFEEKRIELTYRKEEILKSLKVEKEIKDLENNISDENNITKIDDILSLMNRYMMVNRTNKNNNLKSIEDNLTILHNKKFHQMLSKENYTANLVDGSIERYEELKSQMEKLQENIKFVSNIALKNTILDEINSLKDVKVNIEGKLMKLLSCDESSLEQAIKSQRIINTINNSNSPEKIDIALIESNFVDYINLGQDTRKKALIRFIERNHEKYASIAEVSRDLGVIVNKLKNESNGTDTIKV